VPVTAPCDRLIMALPRCLRAALPQALRLPFPSLRELAFSLATPASTSVRGRASAGAFYGTLATLSSMLLINGGITGVSGRSREHTISSWFWSTPLTAASSSSGVRG
jgi:hypothetical protein